MGSDVVLVSSADETAFALRSLLTDAGIARDPADGTGTHTFCSSGDVDWFRALGRRLLGPEPRRGPPGHLRGSLTTTVHPGPSRTDPDPDRFTLLIHRGVHPCPVPTAARHEPTPPDHLRARLHRDGGRQRARVVRQDPRLCTASIDEDGPRWMRNSGKGWVTAEYSMPPGASPNASTARRPRASRAAERSRSSGSSGGRCRVRHAPSVSAR
ncbi:MAG: hypothetical protein R2713_20305 [Ilumatobacteraceae bacterium]